MYEGMIVEKSLTVSFKEYKKHLDPSDVDYVNTEAALELVLNAASHANEMMRKLVCLIIVAFKLK